MTKRCGSCGEARDLGAFPPHRHGRYGVDSHCRRCHVAAARRHAAKLRHAGERKRCVVRGCNCVVVYPGARWCLGHEVTFERGATAAPLELAHAPVSERAWARAG